jgi:hypothetical protein
MMTQSSLKYMNWCYLFCVITFFFAIESIQAQIIDYGNSINYSFQLSFEEQSYIKKTFRNSNWAEIEKSAGICKTIGFNVVKNVELNERINLDLGGGYKEVEQRFDYSEITSSNIDYVEMGISNINSIYITLLFGVSFKTINFKKIVFVPYFHLGSILLLLKEEDIKPIKPTFRSIPNPESTFNSIIPEIIVGFWLYKTSVRNNYIISFGPSISNNPKYYHENIGTLSFPISGSLNIGISKTR